MVTVHVSCKKCKFKEDFGTDGTIKEIEKYYSDYNKEHSDTVDCAHEYTFKERPAFA